MSCKPDVARIPIEQTRHIQDSLDQILVLVFGRKPFKPFQLLPLRTAAEEQLRENCGEVGDS